MSNWKDICRVDDILPNSGRCVLHAGKQVAIFRVQDSGDDTFYAVDNYDPLADANVISRGIVGSQGDTVVVASPLYKQHYCLTTGASLEEDVSLKAWRIRVEDGTVQLA